MEKENEERNNELPVEAEKEPPIDVPVEISAPQLVDPVIALVAQANELKSSAPEPSVEANATIQDPTLATAIQDPTATPNANQKVKRGRGGRRAGAGRKRKSDTAAKSDAAASTPSPSKAKSTQHSVSITPPPASSLQSSAPRVPILSTEKSPNGPPLKKKKLYDELAEGLKKVSSLNPRQLKFGYTILYVKEVEQTVEFYERAFGLKRRFVHESKQYAEMETGVTALSFASNELARSNLSPIEFRPNDPTGLAPGTFCPSLFPLQSAIPPPPNS